MKTKRWFCMSLLLLFLFPINGVQSSNLYPIMDRHLVKEAEFIFVGKVTSIQYKSSAPNTQGDAAIPHTFVTCAIVQVLKGNYSGADTITLRFEGGVSDTDSSLVLEVEGIPIFEEGDEGIFYVRQNGTQMCPLVGWQQGFIRFKDEVVYTYEGNELILNDEPIYAARLHPLDIRNYRSLNQTLVLSSKSIEHLIFTGLSTITQNVLLNPDNPNVIQQAERSQLTYESTSGRTQEIGSIRRLIPSEFRLIPRSINQMLLYRDMSVLLTQRNLFSLDQVKSEAILRPDTEKFLQENQSQMEPERVLLLNRRVLEDLYPALITRSLDQTILSGALNQALTVQKRIIAGKEIQTRASNFATRPDYAPTPDPLPLGTKLNATAYLTHIQKMIAELHTQEELRALPTVSNVNINNAFSAHESTAVQPQAH